MTDPALTKLLKIDSELLAKETELTTRLEALQTKRASLQQVLEMFDSAQKGVASNGNAVAAPASKTVKAKAASEPAVAAPVEAPVKVSRSRQTSRKKDNPSKSSNKAPGEGKSTRRGWQRYVREEFRKTPLPEVVSGVLKGQPKKIFEISVVVDTIFVEKIPQWARKGARERVSNILAEGARKKIWSRGKGGRYSMSEVSE